MRRRRARRWTFVLFVLLAAGPPAGSVRAASAGIKIFFCPSQPIHISSDAGDEVAEFRMALPSRSFGSNHSGGANFVFADGSVHFLRATRSRFVFDPDGNLAEIDAEMVDPRRGETLFFHILPYIEQENLYRFQVTAQDREFEYDAVGRLQRGRRSFLRR